MGQITFCAQPAISERQIIYMKFPSPIMDVHIHITTPRYLDFLDKHDASLEDGFPLPQWHEQEHLDFMETCGISWSLLSLSTPQPYFDNSKNESIALCRSLNEQAALFKQQHPTRIGFMACLPLPCVDAAILPGLYLTVVPFCQTSMTDTSVFPIY